MTGFINKNVSLLALETSGKAGSVSLFFQGTFHQTILPSNVGSTQSLAPAVDELLKISGCNPTQLDAIAVTSGPGSFTGLRVGVSTAKVMAYALKRPTIAVDSLEAMVHDLVYPSPDSSQSSVANGTHLWTLLDAYRGEIFAAHWEYEEGRLFSRNGSQLWNFDAWKMELKNCSPAQLRNTKILGPIGKRLEIDWVTDLGIQLEPTVLPTARAVAAIGLRLFERKDFTDPFALLPKYLRRSAAEEKALEVKAGSSAFPI